MDFAVLLQFTANNPIQQVQALEIFYGANPHINQDWFMQDKAVWPVCH